MGPHARTRRVVKWTGTGALVLLVGVWAVSGWRDACWEDESWIVGVDRGILYSVPQSRYLAYSHVSLYPIDDPRSRPPHFQWWPWAWRPVHGFQIPLWLPALPVLVATGAAWRFDILARRRARAGTHCAGCGYDLAGLPAGVEACPECGAGRIGTAGGCRE